MGGFGGSWEVVEGIYIRVQRGNSVFAEDSLEQLCVAHSSIETSSRILCIFCDKLTF